jgi:hypothetical protein
LLGDVAQARTLANREQRNRLAQLLFEEIVVENVQVATVKPRPELAGFFALDRDARLGTYRAGGSDGIRTRESHTPAEAARLRGSFPLVLRHSRRPTKTRQQRHVSGPQHRPKLPEALWPAVAEAARALGLRQAARAYGISHETVRRIARAAGAARGASGVRAARTSGSGG